MKTKIKERWLNRSLIDGPYLCLCLSQEQFNQAMADLTISNPPPMFKNSRADATVTFFENPKGETVAVVALRNFESAEPTGVTGLLVHEAVHIWQRFRAEIGEDAPGDEIEAYAIQMIAQRLINRFGELNRKKGAKK